VDCAVVEYDLTAAWVTLPEQIDGVDRQVLAFNGEFPGPKIEARIGDDLVIHVHNAFDKGLTVHWHGLAMRGQLIQDGADGVTQCNIMPGNSQTYHINVQQSGTYWYHAHSFTEYVDGLYGPLILREADDKYDLYKCDREEVVIVADWYHTPSQQLFKFFASPASHGNEPVPDNVLINGVGQGYCAPNCQFTTFNVPNTGATKFRIINASAFAHIYVSFDEHVFFVVEVDGVPVIHPGINGVNEINTGQAISSVSEIRINVGQRYAVLVFPKPNDTKSYWLRATMDDSVFPSPSPSNTSLAVVSYGVPEIPTSVPEIQKTVSSKPCPTCIDCNHLIPLLPVATTVPAFTRVEFIDIQFKLDPNHIDRPYLNDISCVLPQDTTFLYLLRAGLPFPADTCSHLDIANGEVVRLIFNNFDDGEHPIHLHGNRFWVLEEAPPSAGAYSESTAKLNLVNPLFRDTATVNPNSYLVIQFVADNPGIWLLHCHIDWHMEVGFMMVINVGLDKVLEHYGTTDKLEKCDY
jgi:FtsP/CotA-like multicopper oxidase with cupredoxin domain